MSIANDGSQQPTLGPVQLIPAGLTGFFQIKQTGRMPSELSQTVRPSLEMRDWYFNSRQLSELQLFSGNIPQTTSIVTGQIGFRNFSIASVNSGVPSGQMWYVHALTVHGGIAVAADTLSFVPVLNPGGTGSLIQLSPPYLDSQIGTARVRNIMAGTITPFWAAPGDLFGVFVLDVLSAAGNALTLRVKATVLPL